MIKNIKWKGKTVAKGYVTIRGERIQREWLKGRFMEGSANDNLLTWVGRNLKRYTGGTFLDCGSHIGNHTLFFATVCKAEKVYAFEPYGPSISQWKRNINLNELTNCELIECALGDKKCRVGIIKNPQDILNQIDHKKSDVQMLRMDAALKGKKIPGGITLIKIDIDGSELIALKGMNKTLAKHKPDIAIECATKAIFKEVAGFMAENNYEIVKRSGKIMRLNPTPTYIYKYAKTT